MWYIQKQNKGTIKAKQNELLDSEHRTDVTRKKGMFQWSVVGYCYSGGRSDLVTYFEMLGIISLKYIVLLLSVLKKKFCKAIFTQLSSSRYNTSMSVL